MPLEGGLRDRYIGEALRRTVHAGLDALGWFAAGRQHSPIVVRWLLPAEQRDKVELPPNTLDVLALDMDDRDLELGSLLTEDSHIYDVDFYGEDESIARHLIGDVRDILRGKCAAAGRTNDIIPVYDYGQDPLPADPEFYVDVERVTLNRATASNQTWERHWHSLRVELVDER